MFSDDEPIALGITLNGVSVSVSKQLVTTKVTEPSPNRVSDKLDPSDSWLPKIHVDTTTTFLALTDRVSKSSWRDIRLIPPWGLPRNVTRPLTDIFMIAPHRLSILRLCLLNNVLAF
jgi:hypothetical protein